jgi:hypothetical protein
MFGFTCFHTSVVSFPAPLCPENRNQEEVQSFVAEFKVHEKTAVSLLGIRKREKAAKAKEALAQAKAKAKADEKVEGK